MRRGAAGTPLHGIVARPSAPIGSLTSLTQYCRRFSSVIVYQPEPRLVDVRVGVE